MILIVLLHCTRYVYVSACVIVPNYSLFISHCTYTMDHHWVISAFYHSLRAFLLAMLFLVKITCQHGIPWQTMSNKQCSNKTVAIASKRTLVIFRYNFIFVVSTTLDLMLFYMTTIYFLFLLYLWHAYKVQMGTTFLAAWMLLRVFLHSQETNLMPFINYIEMIISWNGCACTHSITYISTLNISMNFFYTKISSHSFFKVYHDNKTRKWWRRWYNFSIWKDIEKSIQKINGKMIKIIQKLWLINWKF